MEPSDIIDYFRYDFHIYRSILKEFTVWLCFAHDADLISISSLLITCISRCYNALSQKCHLAPFVMGGQK